MRILLVQLGSTGDCLLVTPLLRQIKLFDYPNSHITWMICSPYKYIVENNPYLDDIIEIPLLDYKDLQTHRNKIDDYIKGLTYHKKFEKIFITDYYSKNLHNWYCTTRSSLFRSYPHRIKVDIKPDLFLSENEKERAIKFCANNKIDSSSFNILIESSPRSGQSIMNIEKALILSQHITSKFPNVRCILSSSNKIHTNHERIIDASVLTWRENKEFLKFCHLLVGSSSAISWLGTSIEFDNFKMIQSINPNYFEKKISSSLILDLKYFGLPNSNIIELLNPNDNILLRCCELVIKGRFKYAKFKYGVNKNYYSFSINALKESYISFYKKIYILIHQTFYKVLQYNFNILKRIILKFKIFI